MKRFKLYTFLMSVLFTFSLMNPAITAAAGNNNGNEKKTKDSKSNKQITPAQRKAAADKFQKDFAKFLPNLTLTRDELVKDKNGQLIPDYFGSANWAYSPPLHKFVDALPGLGADKKNALGQYIPVAVPDTTTYSGSDYYEIAVVEYTEQMHSDLPVTTNRGYVQLSTSVVSGSKVPLTKKDGTTRILLPNGTQAFGADKPHFMGPAIIADSDRPVRIKFYNLLPTGAEGDLFIPVDTTVMGSGTGSMDMNGGIMEENFTQNRANIHLHGNNTVWISDGTPHQWITPAGETTHYPQGVSVKDVPDMADVSSPTDGATTLYYTNTQSARLMFYHDHSYGITRLNVYAGEAAPYILKDKVEKDLIDGTNVSGVNPGLLKILPDLGIPLVIQDRTFVDANTVLKTDPTWSWGTTPGTPKTGDLWYPHVYSPAQNPDDPAGANPFGRWMYGPWFWPPTSDIKNGPIKNPYYDPINAPWEPEMIPGTPNPSAPGENFMDTPVVNGTAYPYLEVDPKSYRFRVLNAANDRFFNLQMYVADSSYASGQPGFNTEVKMISAAGTPGIPADYPSGIPDPSLKGPDWIQIGTEGGFLPAPAVIPSQPITWNLNASNFNYGNVVQHSLLLGTAERADVLVDFSQYAGKTLILYNDAPAPFPAGDPRYDNFTNNPDLTTEGGAASTQPGMGPNMRTIMQIRVKDSAPAAAYNLAALNAAFAKTDTKHGVFEVSQEPIIMPQAAYNSAYNVTNFPSSPSKANVLQHEFSKTFQPINSQGILQPAVTLKLEPKALQDEMGEVFDEYGRMSGYLGLSTPISSSRVSPFIPYGYPSPPVDIFKGIEDINATPIGSLDDGTQIWKITHNGVDTHTIHTHLFTAQLINRVAWDGMMMKPDENELGFKETFRVNPLEHTIIAMRPKVPSASQIPFEVPNSVRLIDPTMPEGAVLMSPPPAGWFDPQGNPLTQILNHKVNFGWEYVYHCHILSHEEMDMMHSMSVAVKPKVPTALTATQTGNGAKKSVVLTWKDNSPNETSFSIQRAAAPGGPWAPLKTLPSGSTTYTDLIGNTKNVYYYRVYAANTVGDTITPGFPTVILDSDYSNTATTGTVQAEPLTAPTNLTATVKPGPQVLLTWKDNATNETGYTIEMSTNSNFTTSLVTKTVPANTTTFQTGNLKGKTKYYFRVKATSDTNQSAWVNASPFPISTP
jgi:FtsP/CotA-like multicopper oxidase with cupredoxin domain